MTEIPKAQQRVLAEVMRADAEQRRLREAYQNARAALVESIERARAEGITLVTLGEAIGVTDKMVWKMVKGAKR